MIRLSSDEFDQHPNATVLAVLLHAYNFEPASMEPVAAAVRSVRPESDIVVPRLPAGLFSFADPEQIVTDLVTLIDELVERQGTSGDAGYRSILLIGHSLGAVLARKVWAVANGAERSGRMGSGHRPWAGKIERIILLAAMNRGWMISSALTPFARLRWSLGTMWANFCRHFLGKEPLILGFRRGAPFLSLVRLQCLEVTRTLQRRGAPLPITVQMLGTDDDYVAPADNVDLATGQDFFFMEVPGVTHSGIVTLAEGDGETGALAMFRASLLADRQTLRSASLSKADLFDLFDENIDDFDESRLPRANGAVCQVVFVIHGIRDRGFWTKRIARRIKQVARESEVTCRTVTSTYGYFPMGPFLLPWDRRAKTEWLLDQYVTAKALYPEAEFAYVGHSNGTYLLAKALDLCEAVRFRHVVFAGSVVRRRYDWKRFLLSDSQRPGFTGRVERVLNYVATADKVVAIFPAGLERLRLQDLGGAGCYGFEAGGCLSNATDPSSTPVVNIEYIAGGHSAALAEHNWDDMARFVIKGTLPILRDTADVQDARVLLLGRLAPLIWAALSLIVLGIGWLILAPLGLPRPWLFGFEPEIWLPDLPIWLFVFLFVGYLGLVRLILTRA